jgi:hypothetical protein
MSQAINHAMQCGSLCFLLGGVGPEHRSQSHQDDRKVVARSGGSEECAAELVRLRTCTLLQPVKRRPMNWLVQVVLRLV